MYSECYGLMIKDHLKRQNFPIIRVEKKEELTVVLND